MNFFKYLSDKRYSLYFFTLLMFFISSVIYLDNRMRISVSNILYINVVSFIFFSMYLIIKYLYVKSYYKTLNDIVKSNEEEFIASVSKPKTYEQKLFYDLINKLYNNQNVKTEKLYISKKDNEEFITSWVHEIKTPISVSRLLIENNLNKPKTETLLSLEEELDKIENYIEQALYYSKIDDFSKDYLIGEIELDRVIKETVKKHAKIFINKKISIDIQNTELTVTTDKKWLSFIIDQVIANSLKYTDHSGNIKVYGIKDIRGQKLIIEDNGIGIKPEDIHRVFDKGFTGHNGRENYKSTGIGLYLSRQLAKKLGHDIQIESVYGEYTKVTIIFPKISDYLSL